MGGAGGAASGGLATKAFLLFLALVLSCMALSVAIPALTLALRKNAEGSPGTDGTDGRDGTTPVLTVGNVTGVPCGTNSSATISGNTTNPVLNLNITQGCDGRNGANGTNGTRTVTFAENNIFYVDTAVPVYPDILTVGTLYLTKGWWYYSVGFTVNALNSSLSVPLTCVTYVDTVGDLFGTPYQGSFIGDMPLTLTGIVNIEASAYELPTSCWTTLAGQYALSEAYPSTYTSYVAILLSTADDPFE